MSTGDLSISVKTLVDTGAPRTILPRGVGDLIGIEFPRYRSDASKKIRFLGQDWAAITETVTLELPPFNDDLRVGGRGGLRPRRRAFLRSSRDEGFLNRWCVTFNGAYGYFVVESADDGDARQPPEVFKDLRSRHPELFE